MTWIVLKLMADLDKSRLYVYSLNIKEDHTGALVHPSGTDLCLAATPAVNRTCMFSFGFSSFLALSFSGVDLLSAPAFGPLHMRG